MIDQVEEVKQKIDIVSIIGERIELKKAGRNFKARCPFHDEKTPSFMVNPELQIYKCFGCGEAGDVFNFLEKYEGMEFGEALKYLAQKAGVKLKAINREKKSEKENIYEVNALALKFYNYILSSHSAGKVALDYLIKERGLKPDTIKTFQLGYSPNVSFAAKKFLVDKHKIPVEQLVKAGLVYKSERGVFDRFRGRVIFPLHDQRGNVVGFAGRILPSDTNKELAKYINTPETPVYHKGNLLYGLNFSRGDIKRAGQAIIVEGELDLISSWQAGVKNVVALKGTAMTPEQISLLSRITSSIILALDADIAGDAAARRGITIAQNQGMDIGVAAFKEYKDPDEAARADAEAYKKALAEPENVWDFFIDSVFSRYNAKSSSGKAKIGREICPILAEIDDKIVQAHYAKVLAERLDVPLEAVTSQIEKTEEKVENKKDDEKVLPKVNKGRRQLLEENLLALSFQGDIEKLIELPENLFETPLLKRIYEEFIVYIQKVENFDPKEFEEELSQELREGFRELVLVDVKDVVDRPDDLKSEVSLIIKELGMLKMKTTLTEMASRMKVLEKDGNSESLKDIEESFSKLSHELSTLKTNK